MAIFNSYVKLPEGIWHQCGCLIHQKDGIIPPWRSVTWVHRWRQVDGIKCTTGDTSTKKGHILSHGATPVAGWLCMLFHGKKPICYKWDDDDLGVPLWLRKPPYVSSATDETEWRWYQHVNGLETWNWTGTLTRALWGVASAHPNRTQWSSACMHTLCQPFRVLIRVTYPLSGHTIHYTKIYHIISIIQVSSTSLSDFECMFLPSCFFKVLLSDIFKWFESNICHNPHSAGPFRSWHRISRPSPRTNALQPTTQLDLADDPSKWNWYNCIYIYISHKIHVWYI